MDIDDILASVTNADRVPQRTSDLQALTRAWVAERCAPELLPYPEELIDRVMERIKTQVSNSSILHMFMFCGLLWSFLYSVWVLGSQSSLVEKTSFFEAKEKVGLREFRTECIRNPREREREDEKKEWQRKKNTARKEAPHKKATKQEQLSRGGKKESKKAHTTITAVQSTKSIAIQQEKTDQIFFCGK